MFFKKIFNRNKDDNFTNEYVLQMQLLKSSIIRLKEFYDNSKKMLIHKKILSIIKTTNKIFNELTINKNKIYKMNLFIEYYIQEVLNILENYFKIVNLKDYESIEMRKTIEKFMDCVVISFEKIYKDLINYDKSDMEIDIKIMLEELKNNIGEC